MQSKQAKRININKSQSEQRHLTQNCIYINSKVDSLKLHASSLYALNKNMRTSKLLHCLVCLMLVRNIASYASNPVAWDEDKRPLGWTKTASNSHLCYGFQNIFGAQVLAGPSVCGMWIGDGCQSCGVSFNAKGEGSGNQDYTPSGAVNTPQYKQPRLPYTSALRLDAYTTPKQAENDGHFAQKYPSEPFEGFATFDSQTCATWDPTRKHQHQATILDLEDRGPHHMRYSRSRSRAQACVAELDKPENYRYYGVTFVSLLYDEGQRKYGGDGWNWKNSPQRGDYKSRTAGIKTGDFGCYFITKRCTKMLPVKFTHSGTLNNDSPGTRDDQGTTGKESGVTRKVHFRYYDPPWSSIVKESTDDIVNGNEPSFNLNKASTSGKNTQVAVTTYLRQRPFTGIQTSTPYMRKNTDAEEDYKIDNDFSKGKLPGFTADKGATLYDSVTVTGVHEVSDSRVHLEATKSNVEYSLVRRGHKCKDMDSLLVNKGLKGTPLDCATACVDVGDWFVRGKLSQQCQCYKKFSSTATPPTTSCVPIRSTNKDLFEMGLTRASEKQKDEWHSIPDKILSNNYDFINGASGSDTLLTLQQCKDRCGLSFWCRTNGFSFQIIDTNSVKGYCRFSSAQSSPIQTYAGYRAALYKLKRPIFFPRHANGCCAEGSEKNCNTIMSAQAATSSSTSTVWLEMSSANTLDACSIACQGVSNWFIFNPKCYCLVKRNAELASGKLAAYQRTANFVLAQGGSTLEHTGPLWTLQRCKEECDKTQGCAVRGFSWMVLNGNNNCRLAISGSIPEVIHIDATSEITLGSAHCASNGKWDVVPDKNLGENYDKAFASTLVTLAQCKSRCSSKQCMANGFSFTFSSSTSTKDDNSDGNCRIPSDTTGMAWSNYPNQNTYMYYKKPCSMAIAGFYRMPSRGNFQCSYRDTFFTAGSNTHLYAFDPEPALLQKDAVCADAGVTSIEKTPVSSLLGCAGACHSISPWFAYGRNTESNTVLSGSTYCKKAGFIWGDKYDPYTVTVAQCAALCDATVGCAEKGFSWHSYQGASNCRIPKYSADPFQLEDQTSNALLVGSAFYGPSACSCRCQNTKTCNTLVASYGLSLYAVDPMLQEPRLPRQRDMLEADTFATDFRNMKCAGSNGLTPSGCVCAWQSIPGYTCMHMMTDIVADKILSSDYVYYNSDSNSENTLQECRTYCLSTMSSCKGFSFTHASPGSIKGYCRFSGGTTFSPSATYTAKKTYLYKVSTSFYLPGVTLEEAYRACVSKRHTHCKYGFSYQASASLAGKVNVFFAQPGRCDSKPSLTSGHLDPASTYVRFTPEKCVETSGPAISSIEDIYAPKPVKSATDHTRLPCAWTLHMDKMCVDAKAYRWRAKNHVRYSVSPKHFPESSVTTTQYLGGSAPEAPENTYEPWGSDDNCNILDESETSPLRTEGMMKRVNDQYQAYSAQSDHDTTGFNVNMNGNYETNFKDFCKVASLQRSRCSIRSNAAIGCDRTTRWDSNNNPVPHGDPVYWAKQAPWNYGGVAYEWTYPMPYERERRELYQWQHMITTTASRTCVLMNVPQSRYYEYHPWRCKACPDGKSCRRQAVYTRDDSISSVEAVELPTVSNWLSACRAKCRAAGAQCNAFVVDEAFGSYKCITLKVQHSTARKTPLLDPIVKQNALLITNKGKVNHKKPAWQMKDKTILHSNYARWPAASGQFKTLQECISQCDEGNSDKNKGFNWCKILGFSFHRSTESGGTDAWDTNDPPKGECRFPISTNGGPYYTQSKSPNEGTLPSSVTDGAYYYQTGTVFNELKNVAFQDDADFMYTLQDYTFHQCRSLFEHDVFSAPYVDRSKRFGFSFTPQSTGSAIVVGICRFPRVLYTTNLHLSEAEYDGATTPWGNRISTTYNYYYHKASCGGSTKECLRNYDVSQPPDTRYVTDGSTLYYPQHQSEPPLVLNVQTASHYEFEPTHSTICADYGYALNGVTKTPLATERPDYTAEPALDGLINSIAVISLDHCKQRCLGTPGCLQHGFSFSSAPVLSGSPSVGVTKNLIWSSGYESAYTGLKLDECYQKCLSIPGCLETGFSWMFSGGISCRIPTLHYRKGTVKPNTQSMSGTGAMYAAYYKANTCFLPHYNARMPCKQVSDPSGLGKFYTIRPKTTAPAGTSIKPQVNGAALTGWTHPFWGARNTVYRADKAHSTSSDYVPELSVAPDGHLSGYQIGRGVIRPYTDFTEVTDSSTSYAGNDPYEGGMASYCHHHCAKTMNCVGFKVDMTKAVAGCLLYGPGTIQPSVTGSSSIGTSFSMTTALSEQSTTSIQSMLGSLGIHYRDLLTPEPLSFDNVDYYYYGVADDGNNKECKRSYKESNGKYTNIVHEIAGLSLEQCMHLRRQLSDGSKNELTWWYGVGSPEGYKRGFSYNPISNDNNKGPSACVIPRFIEDDRYKCLPDPQNEVVGARLYRPRLLKVVQLYSADVNPWFFPQLSFEQCAMKCLSFYMQGCRVFTHSPKRPDGETNKLINNCFLFPEQSFAERVAGGGNNKQLVPTKFTELNYKYTPAGGSETSDTYTSPSYRVLHPSMYMKTNIGIYEYVKDMGAHDQCADVTSSVTIGTTGTHPIEVSATNALVECADRCSEALGSGMYGAKICNAFSIQAPNLCTLYTQCDETTRARAAKTTWNYRIRTDYGPFVYSGAPSQRCEEEYTLETSAAAASGPVHKGASLNTLATCMELCAAHSTKVGKDGNGCGGFSVGDNGACRLHAPCKTTKSATINAAAAADNFKFHRYGASSPLDKAVDVYPENLVPITLHPMAWTEAVDSFCQRTHGAGWRGASLGEADVYQQFGSQLDRRWRYNFGYFNNKQWAGLANSASPNFPACFKPPVTIRYYQLPNAISVYRRLPKLNYACSSLPFMTSSVGDSGDNQDLLQYCADQCNANSLGIEGGTVARAPLQSSLRSSGCVGFTVSTAGHCELHTSCDATSLHYTAPGISMVRVSYSIEA